MKNYLKKTMFRLLTTTCCLTLAMSLQAIATAAVQQPQALLADAAVTPVGCTDTCCGEDSSSCGGGTCSSGSCANDSCGSSCCKAVCCPKQVETEVKKHCWKVSTKQICIPGFTFKLNGLKLNWDRPRCLQPGCDKLGCTDCSSGPACGDTCCGGDCDGGSCGLGCCDSGKCQNGCCDCPPKCGRVRCIKVLEKHEYTCDKCGYEWEVKCVRSSKGRSSKGRSSKGRGGCGCPSCGTKTQGCCASTESVDSDIQLTSATEELSTTTSEETEVKATKKPSLTRRMMSLLK